MYIRWDFPQNTFVGRPPRRRSNHTVTWPAENIKLNFKFSLKFEICSKSDEISLKSLRQGVSIPAREILASFRCQKMARNAIKVIKTFHKHTERRVHTTTTRSRLFLSYNKTKSNNSKLHFFLIFF